MEKKSLLNEIRISATDIFWLIPFILTLLWTIDSFLSIFVTGFSPFDAWVLVSIIIKIGFTAANFYFLWELFIRKNIKKYAIFQMYVGYAVVGVYVSYALPRLSWEMQNLLTPDRVFDLWVLSFISTVFPAVTYLMVRFHVTRIKWGVITEKDWKERKAKKKAKAKKKRSIPEIIEEYVHVVIQAIIMVIILQHFLFQLYEIPSESMVPTFLIRDKTFVTKFQSGPTIPLTELRLPTLIKPQRGNVVVFESPDYTQPSLVKLLFQQLVFYLTLGNLDIDQDEAGNTRVHFVVKRLIGVPGDKLMMIDDTVYIRNQGDSDFKKLEIDDEKYSQTDLYNEDMGILSRISHVPIDINMRNLLGEWDDYKAGNSIGYFANRLEERWKQYKLKLKNVTDANIRRFEAVIKELFFPLDTVDYVKIRDGLAGDNVKFYQWVSSYLYYLPQTTEIRRKYFGKLENKFGFISVDLRFFISFIGDIGEQAFFEKFIDAGLYSRNVNETGELNRFEEDSIKLNLQVKSYILDRFNVYLDIMNQPEPSLDVFDTDTEVKLMFDNMLNLYFRYLRLYDYRNFPEFPAGKDNYIPEGKYFLMGDNRYNSLDFRYYHGNSFIRNLTEHDAYPCRYESNLQPFLLPEENILGFAVARIWPLDRMGIISD
ncbi:MAG: signal peptidase I [Spirochaetales bacterium]|nr:signal peptidase I [Spirochaetales bacterium]